MKIPLQAAVKAMGAGILGVPPEFVRCSIDTRRMLPGDVYLALRGERFDGHDFIAEARGKGAAAAIVDDAARVPEGMAAFVVADTRAALFALALAAREAFCGAVVAVTGSAGKTTTKDLLSQLLREAKIGTIAASHANENNEIGVSKLLLGLENEAAVIVEMGARHPGDIGALVALARPHYGLLTMIGDAHLEIFGTPQRLADTKWELFSNGARALLAVKDPESRKRAARLAEPAIFFGLSDEYDASSLPDFRQLVLLSEHELLVETPGRPPQRIALELGLPGQHNRRNFVAAAAAALTLGVALPVIARAAAHLKLPIGRYQRLVAPNGVTVIDDAYNASPSGTLASLRAFSAEGGRRIVVLSSMAELGTYAPEEHRRVGRALPEVAPALALLGGEHAADLEEGARAAGFPAERIIRFSENAEALHTLREVTRPGDIIFLKGSRKYHLEEIVDALVSVPALREH